MAAKPVACSVAVRPDKLVWLGAILLLAPSLVVGAESAWASVFSPSPRDQAPGIAFAIIGFALVALEIVSVFMRSRLAALVILIICTCLLVPIFGNLIRTSMTATQAALVTGIGIYVGCVLALHFRWWRLLLGSCLGPQA